MYGLMTKGEKGEEVPAKKPTGFLTSSWANADELSCTCDGGHVHQSLMGGRAKDAAIYPTYSLKQSVEA